jgi:N-carbamoyl-L-amino-acid hydrolase
MKSDMLHINEERFRRNLADLAQIGRLTEAEGGGLDRRPFSPAERQARKYFREQAEAAGLETVTDGAANLSARLPAERAKAQTLLLGSHLDTVPNGGPYDGALGVVAALEVLRTVRERGISLPLHLEAIAFTDEEGRFGDFFGSQGFIGGHTASSIDNYLTRAGHYPADLAAMQDLIPGGLSPSSVFSARRDPEAIAGFIEIHIEQGPRLEREGKAIGVVDVIFGRKSMRLEFHGRSDHAGTTPLPLRADALVAAAQFIAQAPRMAQRQFPNAVVTCGNVTVTPGVFNVVPNRATVSVEHRAASTETLMEMNRVLLALAEESTAGSDDLALAVFPTDEQEPVAMDDSIKAAIHQASDTLGYPTMALSSGALHDAGVLAAIAPTGLIFVPSKGGRSHCPDEDTEAADLVAGANVLLHTTLTFCARYGKKNN